MTEGSSSEQAKKTESTDTSPSVKADFSNVLSHVKELERQLEEMRGKNSVLEAQNQKMSQKTQEDMRKIAESIYKTWLKDLPIDNEKVKQDFKCSMDNFVKNAAEDNGVWQMMVAASAMHTQRQHDFDKLQQENEDLRKRVDGLYADSNSRTVGEKSKAEEQMSRNDVQGESMSAMWDDFAKQIGSVY